MKICDVCETNGNIDNPVRTYLLSFGFQYFPGMQRDCPDADQQQAMELCRTCAGMVAADIGIAVARQVGTGWEK